MSVLLTLAAKELAAHLGLDSVDRAFTALPVYAPKPQTGPAKIAALQVEAKVYPSLQAMLRDIDRYMLAAVQKGARLVCFPELFGLFAAFASPMVRTAFGPAVKRLLGGAVGQGDSAGEKTDYVKLAAPFAFLPQRYIQLMARFARRYGAWISCGSVFTYENGRLYNRHTLLDDTGTVAGTQDKLHLVPEEAALGLSRGKSLTVVESPFGRIALTVCMDATYFETFAIAKGLGADFALVPIANMEPYNPYLALRGAAMRTSETGLAAVKPALVSGRGFPVEITGRAGVYYPLGCGAKSREAPAGGGPACLVEALDVEALRACRSKVFCLRNKAIARQLMQAYQDYPGA